MSNAKQIIDIVYNTLADSNLSRVLPVLDDQIVLHIPGHMPFGGIYHGRSGFLTLMSNVFKLWDTLKLNSLTYFAPDDSEPETALVALGQFEGKLSGVDESFFMPFIHYWQLKDGKVIGLRAFYWDTESLQNHFQPQRKGPDSSANGHHTSEN